MNEPSNRNTHERIVRAATTLFVRHGFKRTSIDLLATEAGVAKPTVYAYFDNKEAVFGAVVASLCQSILDEATAASARKVSLEARLTAMLSAKHTRYWALVHTSPHAQELIDAKSTLGRDEIERFDREFLALISAVVEQPGELALERVGLTPPEAARLLIRATSGAMYDATSEQTHAAHVGQIVRALLTGLREPSGATAPRRRR